MLVNVIVFAVHGASAGAITAVIIGILVALGGMTFAVMLATYLGVVVALGVALGPHLVALAIFVLTFSMVLFQMSSDFSDLAHRKASLVSYAGLILFSLSAAAGVSIFTSFFLFLSRSR